MGNKYLMGKKDNYIMVGKKVKGAMGKPKSMVGGTKTALPPMKGTNKVKA